MVSSELSSDRLVALARKKKITVYTQKLKFFVLNTIRKREEGS